MSNPITFRRLRDTAANFERHTGGRVVCSVEQSGCRAPGPRMYWVHVTGVEEVRSRQSDGMTARECHEFLRGMMWGALAIEPLTGTDGYTRGAS